MKNLVDKYEINASTLVVLPKNDKFYIVELYQNYYSLLDGNSIIKRSCEYFGSSYEGRASASSLILNSRVKVPIVIEESKNLIFFPTNSIRDKNCIWVSFNNLIKYERKDKDNTILFFERNKYVEVPVSYYVIDNQITRCIKLEREILKRKNII